VLAGKYFSRSDLDRMLREAARAAAEPDAAVSSGSTASGGSE
jgi:hypothetical protein